jgi:hypothetical protein
MLRRVARGNCTPRRSQIPDLNVSAHPALIVRSPPDATMANEQIAVQPANLFALLTDQTRLSPCLRGLLLPGFHQSSHLFLALDITTLATGHSPRVGLSPTGFAASFAARGLTPPSECALPGAQKKRGRRMAASCDRTERLSRLPCPQTPSACANARDDAACAAPSPRSGGCAHG